MAKTPVTKASSPPGKGGGSGLHKQVAGVPAWMWGVGAVTVVGGYLYMRSHQSPAGAQQQPGTGGMAGSPTGLSFSQLQLILKDWQEHHGHKGGGGHHHHHKKPHAHNGPERQWLIKKTGSQHPWTFLARHHERIVIGPHGTRTIVPDKRGKR